MASSSLCFLLNPLPVFGPLLIVAGFLGHGFLSVFITSLLLSLSTLLFKQKPNLNQNDEISTRPDDGNSPSFRNKSIPKREEKTDQVQEIEECLARKSVSEQSEDSEVMEWMRQDGFFRSEKWSDCSISDEDSLIEIELPDGHFVGSYKEEEEEEEDCKKKLEDMEMKVFQELNEEENLIEIDISMGSIKCSMFEIES